MKYKDITAKLLTMLLSVVLCAGTLAVPVFAEGEEGDGGVVNETTMPLSVDEEEDSSEAEDITLKEQEYITLTIHGSTREGELDELAEPVVINNVPKGTSYKDALAIIGKTTGSVNIDTSELGSDFKYYAAWNLKHPLSTYSTSTEAMNDRFTGSEILNEDTDSYIPYSINVVGEITVEAPVCGSSAANTKPSVTVPDDALYFAGESYNIWCQGSSSPRSYTGEITGGKDYHVYYIMKLDWGYFSDENTEAVTVNGGEYENLWMYGTDKLGFIFKVSAVHDTEDWTVTKEPTETEKGEREAKCAGCSETIREELPRIIKSVSLTLKTPLCGTETRPEVTVDGANVAGLLPVNTWKKDGKPFSGKKIGGENYTALIVLDVPKENQSEYNFADDCAVTVNGKNIDPSYRRGITLFVEADVTAEHDWSDWEVTKEATNAYDGEKTRVCKGCGEKQTQAIPVLVAKTIASGKRAVKVSWNKVEGADRYVIYMAKCNYNGKKYKTKRIKTVSANKLSFKKKGLKKKTAYKFYVVAEKKSGGSYKTVAKSVQAHVLTGNVRGKLTNPKKLTLNKTSLTLAKGKTATISGKVTKVKKSKKLATSHAKLLRFTSNNPTVATVDASGKVTAKSPGTATIYVQTINGIWKTCKVTVK